MEKTKLVVMDEMVLGYILPELKDYVQVLHASVLRGFNSTVEPSSLLISKKSNIRLATPKDFHDYRVSFTCFNNEEYEYIPL